MTLQRTTLRPCSTSRPPVEVEIEEATSDDVLVDRADGLEQEQHSALRSQPHSGASTPRRSVLLSVVRPTPGQRFGLNRMASQLPRRWSPQWRRRYQRRYRVTRLLQEGSLPMPKDIIWVAHNFRRYEPRHRWRHILRDLRSQEARFGLAELWAILDVAEAAILAVPRRRALEKGKQDRPPLSSHGTVTLHTKQEFRKS